MTKKFKRQTEQCFKKLQRLMFDYIGLVKWDCSLFLAEKENYLVLDCIFVHEKERKKGKARLSMNYLCDYADKYNLKIFLEPSDVYGMSIDVLIRFYKSFGFIKNTNIKINKNIKTLYFRKPVTLK